MTPSVDRQFISGQGRWGLVGVLILTAMLFLLSACIRSTIPMDATAMYEIQPIDEPATAATPNPGSIFQPAGTYALVWLPEDETLKLRVPAGIAGSIVDELEYDTRGIRVTGNTTSLGSSLWVEIQGPDGEQGWVNSWNLTEDVTRDDFCADTRVLAVLERTTQALAVENIEGLVQFINPKRGLVLRHDWWNPEVIIRSSDLTNMYLSRADIDWGVLRGGDFVIEGSFSEIYSPLLYDVLSRTPTAVCGEIPSGVTSLPVVWPGEYANIHYYALHRPNPEGGNRFDWRTLVFGFEYIQGEPYLTLLVHFHGDI